MTTATEQDGAGAQVPSPEDLKIYAIQQKYAAEAAKRIRPEFGGQFIALKDAEERFRVLEQDPWADHDALNARQNTKDGKQYKFVILGGGFGGMILAVRLIEAGLTNGPDDVRIIENGGGFGGTWYWNRYPGLHCDVESYTYLPLLEETGYMPKSKYSPGEEIREHAERIATQYNLHDKALFRSKVETARWDDDNQLWNLKVTEGRGPNKSPRELNIQAEYFLTASGVFPRPQVPKIPGLSTFASPMFHTARWDYNVTGGSQDDPRLTNLEGKRVGILGTGATAIQAIPHLAKYAKELYVFQRTPSNVWPRGQQPTDPEEWKTKIAYKKGWQPERMRNFNMHLTNNTTPDQPNFVKDEWTNLTSYCASVGCPKWGYIDPTPEAIGVHVGRLLKLDLPRTEAGRGRTDEIVKDKETADKLKGWYPIWCKRPTFSDEYLQTFNKEGVNLVDTDGKGVDAANERGLIVNGVEYPLDVLVLSTGFITPVEGGGNPSIRAAVEMYGRGGKKMSDKWTEKGATTLHGLFTNGFPNLFFQSPLQAASGANYVYSIEVWTKHIVEIIKEAQRRVQGHRAVVEPGVVAEEKWSGEIMRHGPYYAGLMGCTPGYVTGEGSMAVLPTDPVEMMKMARLGTWSFGLESFMDVLEKYREGGFEGIEVSGV